MSKVQTQAGRFLVVALRSLGWGHDAAMHDVGDVEIDAVLDEERLTRAVAAEVEVDEKHGFPAGFTAADLARNIIDTYADLE